MANDHQVCLPCCTEHSPGHQHRKQVDTEAAAGQDKAPESCDAKATCETCRLVHTHMEDTWKAAISEKPKE